MELRKKPALILSTDLDGTLLGRGNYMLGDTLPQLIEEITRRVTVIWAINTGRRYASVLDVVQRAEIVRRPDYLVDRETFLYYGSERDYLPVADWNDRAKERVDAVAATVGPYVDEWSTRISQAFPHAKVRLDAGVPLSVQSRDVAQAHAVRDALLAWTRGMPDVRIVRNGIWVAIWADGYDKGSVLAEIARRHRVDRSRILAVGDSDNDLPMLSRRVCGFPVAPANAEESVKEFVRKENGWVSHAPDIDGVMDGVRQFLQQLGT